MTYILDTNICILWLKGQARVKDNIDLHPTDHVTTTIVTACELYYGAAKSVKQAENKRLIDELLQPSP